MATYYVKTGGNDLLDGLSPANAWATITKVNATSLAAGDQVLFNGGDSFSGKIYLANSGSSGNPIVFSSYGTGNATITNGSDNAFFIYNASYTTISNFTITGGATAMGNGSAGIGYYSDGGTKRNGITISGVTVTQFTHGISIGSGAASSGFNTISVTNSTLYGNTTNGLLTYGPGPDYAVTNVTITSVVAHSNLGDSGNTTAATGNGIVLGSCDTATIDYCTAYNNGTSNACTTIGPVGIWCYDSTAVRIKRSVAYSNGTGTAIDGDGFDLDINVSNSVIEYCLAYNNYGAGILIYGTPSTATNTNNVVRYNMCWGNGQNPIGTPYGEFAAAGTYQNLDVYNNTFVARNSGTSNPYCVWFDGTPNNGTALRNNIIYAATGYNVKAQSNYAIAKVLLQGNAYYRSGGLEINWNGAVYTTLASWRAAVTGQEVVGGSNTGVTSDPLLNNAATTPTVTDPTVLTGAFNLKYQVGSPMIDAGIDLNSTFGLSVGTVDYFGAALSAPYNIGAAGDPGISPSASTSPSASRSPSASLSPSASRSPSASISPSSSASPSISPSASRSPSSSISSSASPSYSPSASNSPSSSISASYSPSSSTSPSSSISSSISLSPSAAFDVPVHRVTARQVEDSIVAVQAAPIDIRIID